VVSLSQLSAGQRARFVRKNILGKSQDQLSLEFNYDKATISRMERGTRPVSQGFAELLASVPECRDMGIRPEWIQGLDNYQTEADKAVSRFVVDCHEEMKSEFIAYIAELLGDRYKGCDSLQYTFKCANGKTVSLDYHSDKMQDFQKDVFDYAKKRLLKVIEI